MAEDLRTEVFKAGDIRRALTRIGYEIVEGEKGVDDFVLMGIHSRGVPLAYRIAEAIARAGNTERDPASIVGELDITRFRDDRSSKPAREERETRLPEGGIEGRTVILVDDVLYSGRTVRAALDALSALGRQRACVRASTPPSAKQSCRQCQRRARHTQAQNASLPRAAGSARLR